ncbi:MAG: ribosome-associated translation inhibitor RaiA [Elusimicrobia bacterium]|nr:ribosome-associated translation inhibitor RaiA [Elusimicrobiota bacterium]
MTVHIVARHVKLTKALKDFIQERMDKLQHYFDNIIWAQVVLTVEKKSQGAEIVLHAARQTFQASAKTTDMYSSVDMCAEKIEKQIRKYKEKMKDHRVADEEPSVIQDYSLPPQGEIRFSVIKKVPVAPMTADDAALEMERMGYNFWMFMDQESNKIQVIFKRLDNTYGLLQPVKR